ncbi:unnamed protein product, partial [Hymenolepis diminuta]
EEQHCSNDQVSAIGKRRARRKRNIQKPEVGNLPKIPQPETKCRYPRQALPYNSSTTPSSCNSYPNRFRVSKTSNSFKSRLFNETDTTPFTSVFINTSSTLPPQHLNITFI